MGKQKPVTIRGTTYKSHTEAARALGVSRSTISGAVAEGALDGVGTQVQSYVGKNPTSIAFKMGGASMEKLTAFAVERNITKSEAARMMVEAGMREMGLLD